MMLPDLQSRNRNCPKAHESGKGDFYILAYKNMVSYTVIAAFTFLLGCNEHENSPPSIPSQKKTEIKIPERYLFPQHLVMGGLTVTHTYSANDGMAVGAKLEGNFSAYELYMVYPSVLEDNEWTITNKTEKDGNYLISANNSSINAINIYGGIF